MSLVKIQSPPTEFQGPLQRENAALITMKCQVGITSA